MNSKIYNFCKELENCTLCLEDDVARSLQDLYQTRFFDESTSAQESTKDYHYKEILNHLREIKDHIKTILKHDQLLNDDNRHSASTIDKEYIKKQVETFQNYGTVSRRLQKPVRSLEASSMKFLECWEMMLDQQEQNKLTFEVTREPVMKRENSLRKHKKIISSTVETFLESPLSENSVLETLSEEELNSNSTNEVETVNTELVGTTVDRKPRIVGLVVST